jgi:hypothetical protein
MWDYVSVVVSEGRELPRPLALIGWSMGGLVAWMAAEQLEPDVLVLIEPSPPLEVQGSDPEIPFERGAFDPEEAYGPFPEGFTARPESLLARVERKRGISVPVPTCPCLVISGHEFAEVRGRAIAEHLRSRELAFPDLSHWELVTDRRVVDGVAEALDL